MPSRPAGRKTVRGCTVRTTLQALWMVAVAAALVAECVCKRTAEDWAREAAAEDSLGQEAEA